ncbi:MAG TPA: beta-ketoacyl synthase N-terminal-like domain-containing protein [Blastocatellia bacterium]|nr:beta-ketoacyl synthase N-terminal-like domain-containing protein [Blastocatellia bacterium]
MSDSVEFDLEGSQGTAIIGMACRFPGAKDIHEFWHILKEGLESVAFFSEREQLEAGLPPALLGKSGLVNAGALLEDPEYFDAAFFGFTPREAEVMDPQHRVFLETAWQALEHAGYDSGKYAGRVGVYCGASMSTYLLFNLLSNPEAIESIGDLPATIGNDKDFLPMRVSHRLNLKGPSMDVQSACSTSLVAVHLACQSLMAGESDMALAGGVSISFPQKMGYMYQEGGLFSPDGHCRAFDAAGQGTVEGNGAGVVILKRLADAIADGDTILAVIKGSAVNNDGAARANFAAPSVEGQTAVIEEALALSGVDAETITYMEAHGGGTSLGDSIEVAAMTRAFRASTEKKRFCAVGSVKTNIGHLNAAAGVASLIKCVLALQHKAIPASLNFEQPNPNIDFDNSPFYVSERLSEWPAKDAPRRAGVNSFGIGGTNAHIILEEAPPPEESRTARPCHLLLLSAKTEAALERATANLIEHLRKTRDRAELANIAYTLQVGRRSFNHRRMLVCEDLEDALSALEERDPSRVRGSVEGAADRPVAFLFPGSLGDYASLGDELYRDEPTFKEHFDLCCDLLEPILGPGIRAALHGREQELKRPSLQRCAVFVNEYSLAKLWIEWGVEPQAMLGSGAGEYVAACLAGVMSVDAALKMLAGEDSSEAFEAFEGIAFEPHQIPFVSSATGKWITSTEASDPVYWSRLPGEPDRFEQGLRELVSDEDFLLLEVGPGRASSFLAESRPKRRAPFASVKRGGHTDPAFLLDVLGSLWLAGAQLKWGGFYAHERPRHIPLPTYPFERRRYWIAPRLLPQAALGPRGPIEQSQDVDDVADRFYFPVWKHSAPRPARKAGESFAAKARWLVFNDRVGLGDRLIERLRSEGQAVTTVAQGESFERLGHSDFRINAERVEDYRSLFDELRAIDHIPDRIIHLWSVTRDDSDDPEEVAPVRVQTLSFYSLLFLMQAVADQNVEGTLDLWAISNGAQAVSGDETLCPMKALLMGPCKVIAKENPNITCRSIDIAIARNGGPTRQRVVDQLIAEFSLGSKDSNIAYRGSHRLTQSFEKITLDGQGDGSPTLRRGGVYLITGGLGKVGLELASVIATAARAKVALLDIISLPEREQWDDWLASRGADDYTGRAILKLRALEDAGAELLILRADVTDQSQVRDSIARVVNRFGAINGVVHAASATEEALIQVGAAGKARQVLAPKVEGTLILDRLLGDARLDFFALCSSLKSILGEPARASACAADAFLDAYAHLKAYENGTPAIAIDWDQGQEGMRAGDGADAFNRILNSRLPQVVVSARDLGALIERSNSLKASALLRELEQAASFRQAHPRPALGTPYVAPAGQAEETLSRAWKHVFGFERIGIHDNFFELGGDSIMSVQIAAQANKSGLRVTAKQVLEHPTIAELVRAAAPAGDATTSADSGTVAGPVPITPTQSHLLDQYSAGASLTRSLLLDAPAQASAEAIARSVATLIDRHAALRLRYSKAPSGWEQSIAPADRIANFSQIDLGHLSRHDQESFMRDAAADAERGLSVEGGPSFKALLFDLGAGRQSRLLLVAHQFAVDETSWKILVEDLRSMYEQMSGREKTAPAFKTSPFKLWAERLAELAKSDAVGSETSYWLERGSLQATVPPSNSAAEDAAREVVGVLDVDFSEEETKAILGEVAEIYHAQPRDLMLTALALAMRNFTAEEGLTVALESDGREAALTGLDFSRTVGCFSIIFPALLRLDGGADVEVEEALKTIKEQLRQVPNKGLGYELLKLSRGIDGLEAGAQSVPRPQVSFKFFGPLDTQDEPGGLFRVVRDSASARRVQSLDSGELLAITGSVIEGRLLFKWVYNEFRFHRSGIEQAAVDFAGSLRALITSSQSPQASGYTPSDFADFNWSQKDLDKISKTISSKLKNAGPK